MNRFTGELISTGCFGFWHLDEMMGCTRKPVMHPYAWPELERLDAESSYMLNRRDVRIMFYAMLAVLSDYDLMECFGI